MAIHLTADQIDRLGKVTDGSLAREVGCSISAITATRKRLGIAVAVPKTCQTCGNEFTATRHTQTYCCAACQARSRPGRTSLGLEVIAIQSPPTETATCVQCGASFQRALKSVPRIYCSRKCVQLACYHRNKSPRPVQHCEQCGTEIASERSAKYCSRLCWSRAAAQRRHGVRTCPGCGVEFQNTRKNREYCSRKCRRKHNG